MKLWFKKGTAADGGAGSAHGSRITPAALCAAALLTGVLAACAVTALAVDGDAALGATAAQRVWLIHVVPLLAYALFVPVAALLPSARARNVTLVGGCVLVLSASALALAGRSDPSTIRVALAGIGLGAALTIVGTLPSLLTQRAVGRWVWRWISSYGGGLVAGWMLGSSVAASAWRFLLVSLASAVLVLMVVGHSASRGEPVRVVKVDRTAAVLWGAEVALIAACHLSLIIYGWAGTAMLLALMLMLSTGCTAWDRHVGVPRARTAVALAVIAVAIMLTEWALTQRQEAELSLGLLLLALAGPPVVAAMALWRVWAHPTVEAMASKR